ncbi:MAG: DeoR/GlpR transcriptional regulator [Gammaproteobacteria bacterium]|nr:DeoR/GlpR transcriptional regulator [Gammaproteobacteria bacterium]
MISRIERQVEILRIIEETGKVLVSTLVDLFAVSAVTIRFDLNLLNSKGVITRCRGGAVSLSPLAKKIQGSTSYENKNSIEENLTSSAIKLLENGDAVYFDPKMASENLTTCLSDLKNIKLLTNGISVAKQAAEHENLELILIGGKLCTKSMAFHGHQAECEANNYHFDKTFLVVDKFDCRVGITTNEEYKSDLIKALCENSSEIIVICKSINLGKSHCHIIANNQKISTLITDKGIKEVDVEAFKSSGIKRILSE